MAAATSLPHWEARNPVLFFGSCVSERRFGWGISGLLLACVLLSTTDGHARRRRGAKEQSTAPMAEAPPRPVWVNPAADERLRTALNEVLQRESLAGAEVGFLATSLDDSSVIAESGADLLINPASNAKLLTAAAALHFLKPEYRFRTEYFVRGTLRNGTLQGDLVVKGYGDPTIVTERLQRVANELYLFGIERITGGIILDESFFDDQSEAAGWDLEDAPDRAYAAGVGALSFNYNAISAYVRPGEVGGPAVVKLDPPVEAAVLEGQVTTGRWRTGMHVFTRHDKETGKTLVQVGGNLGARDSPRRWYRRMWDPGLYFGSALVAFLQQRGVSVRHIVVRERVPAGARLIFVDLSPSLSDIV
ncbi:MAG: D-alanyl-D-alanine carboxypeptidase/D-alanyl-D-alanine endopeptidase, partial [Myxococcota bacterium]